MTDWKGKSILVTGGAGFIGANLVRELVQRHASVFLFVRSDSARSAAEALWRLRDVQSSLTVLPVNLLNRSDVLEAVEQIRPDFVFHLAVGRSNSYDLLAGSVLGTHHLLEALERCGNLRRFIHGTSSLEYGRSMSPLEEKQRIAPDTFYGAAKAAGTMLVQQRMSAGFPAVVLRIFSVYGYWEAHHRLIPTVMRSCLEGKEILLTEPGYRRDFIFVTDTVDALLAAAQVDDATGETFNVATGIQTTNEEAVDLIQTILGSAAPVRVGAYTPHITDTTFWVGNPGHAERVLGWKAQTSLRLGLEKTIRWYQLNHSLYPAGQQNFV